VRGLVGVGLALLACVPASAGELLFVNGSRLEGELSNEALMVSTGSGLVEIAPEDVLSISKDEIRLRDGRVIRGTLVGGHIKAKTALGEIAVKVDELQMYRTGTRSTGALSRAAAVPATAQPVAAASAATPAPATPAATNGAVSSGLPTMASYQDGSSTARQGSAQPAALTRESPPDASNRMLEVVDSGVLYRDALFSSSHVGQVATGQHVRYVDSIDRRLRILNLLVFDGGYWIKVRLTDGTEGWVPAATVREVR
jgi:hypothetical protein